MKEKQKDPKQKRSVLKRIGRGAAIFLLVVVAIVGLIIVLIQTPFGQNIIRKEAQKFLAEKLKTRVEIGHLYIGFPNKIELKNIFIGDQQKDTLLSGGLLKVDLDMMKLLSNEIDIREVQLQDITAKITRVLPDTTFNFQFITEAFASDEKKPEAVNDTTALSMSLRKLLLDRVRLVYNDVVTGNDMEVFIGHNETRMNKLDPSHQTYDVALLKLDGVRGRVYQNNPLRLTPAVEQLKDSTSPSTPPTLIFKDIDLTRVALDYRNEVSGFYTDIKMGQLAGNVRRFDLAGMVLDLNGLTLNNTTAAVRLGKKKGADPGIKKDTLVADTSSKGWRIAVDRIRLDNNNIKFDDDNKVPQKKGMDYVHLNAQNLTLHVDNFLFAPDSIMGNIVKGSMTEQSGFVLNELQTQFAYTARGAELNDLVLKTPGTSLQRNVQLRYNSTDDFKNHPEQVQLNVDLANSYIRMADVLTFVPSLSSQKLFSNPAQTLYVTAKMDGTMDDMRIAALQLRGIGNTRADLRGRILHMTDTKRLNADLVITEIYTTRADIGLFVPANTLPKSVQLPSTMRLAGTLKGGMQSIITDLRLNTDLGAAGVRGSMSQFTDKNRARYDMTVTTNALNLGRILKNDSTFGKITARVQAKGAGFDPQTANARLAGNVASADIKGYTYRDFTFDGSLAQQQLELTADIHDPNISLALNVAGSMAQKYPALTLDLQIDSIKTRELNLTTEPIVYKGKVIADFPVTNPDSLEGQLLVTNSLLVTADNRINLDTMSILAGQNDSGRFIRLATDIATAEMYGQYKLTELGGVIKNSIEPYFAVKDSTRDSSLAPYNFNIVATVVDRPLLRAFMPDLKRLEPINLQSHFVSDSGFTAVLTAPGIVNGENQVSNVRFAANTTADSLLVRASVGGVQAGKSVKVFQTNINAGIADNKINFGLVSQDRNGKAKYSLAALFEQPERGTYALSLKPGGVLLNYDQWTIDNENRIVITPGGVNVNQFALSQNGQQLVINSQGREETAPIDVKFNAFQIATLTAFVKQDSLFATGRLDGLVTLKDVMKQPVFTSDLNVTDFAMNSDTLGNISMKVNNTVANTYAADVKIDGKGNDIRLTGNYYNKPDNQSTFDLLADIRTVQLNTLEGVSNGAIRDASGTVNGKFTVNGTVAKPLVNGDLNFNKTRFNLGMLNSYFAIDQEKIAVNPEGIVFNTFTVLDSAGNKLVLDGTAKTANFTNYNFDLTLRARDFHALHTTKKDSKLYYGDLFFTTNLNIAGTEAKPKIDGSLTINDRTRLTVVLPQKEPGVEEREGIIQFVDFDADASDSTLFAAFDSLNTSPLVGMDVNLNLEISKQAQLSMIIDESNGDFINVQGEALLNAGIDPSGKVTMTGTYELESGAYELTLNLLRRKFNIQKGSKITWKGEPTQADVDITAVYVASAPPLELVENQLNDVERVTFRQKLPFEVDLKMQGELLKPRISFDIILPDNRNYSVSKDIIETVNQRLVQLRTQPSELNKQVFALLLLNRFVAENPFQSSGGMTPESFARKSVSKLLTEQLNQLATGLIQGVDLNFDVVSEDDYTSGSRQNRTDLNVALSKKLLNDRLTVTVGSNFELEGTKQTNRQSTNIAGNVALDYRLSKDGRYMLRAYRKNDYQGVLEGYIIETGVGFIMTIDYNKFKEIFESAKKREKRREERRKQRELEEQRNKPQSKQIVPDTNTPNP